MIKKNEDNIRSESYYPDSNYYLDQRVILKRLHVQKIKLPIIPNLNGQIAIGILGNKWQACNDRSWLSLLTIVYLDG